MVLGALFWCYYFKLCLNVEALSKSKSTWLGQYHSCLQLCNLDENNRPAIVVGTFDVCAICKRHNRIYSDL